ncbi:MAG: hypothetical protein AAB426_05680, partial [Myxococcota bacterium]
MTVVLSAAVTALGFLTLLGWWLDLPLLASFSSDLIPMAPSTALLFVAYGVALGLRAYAVPGRRANLFGSVLASLASVVALTLLVTSLVGIRSPIEHLGFRIAGDVHGAPVGHMSPMTAACFLLAGLSVLMSLPVAALGSVRRLVAFGSAGALLGTSLVFLLAYLYGKPLLYGGGIIPPALNTTLAFAVLGIGLLVVTGHRGPTPAAPYPKSHASGWFLLVFVALAAVLIAAGRFYHHAYERHYRAEVEQQLAAVAGLKAGELTQWRRERLGDGTVFFGNDNLSDLVQRCLQTPDDPSLRASLTTWLQRVRQAYPYDRVLLLDAHGVEIAADPTSEEPVSPALQAAASESLRAPQVSFLAFYRDGPGRPLYLSV